MMLKETKSPPKIDSEKIEKNGWRQGAFLFIDDATKISIETPSRQDCLPEGLYVVLTQDCDLLNPDLQKEPVAELILGHEKPKPEPLLLSGKNPRKLHLKLNLTEKNCLEFLPQNRFFIARSYLENLKSSETLELKDLKILIHWIVSRYKRAGFPNVFNERVSAKVEAIKKILSGYCHNTLGVFMRLSTEKELPTDLSYSVSMLMLVEKLTYEQEDERKKIQEGFDKISELFLDVLGVDLLDDSEVKSMDAISAHEYGLLKQWDFDYLSFSNDKNGITAYDTMNI